jgi:L-malate glycosyltransferase
MPMPGTEVSFRLHPVTTSRGAADLARSTAAVRRLARVWRADVIHANGVRAGLLSIGAARPGGPPLVVQVHDHLPRNALGLMVRLIIAAGADRVMAVSRSTAHDFDAGLPRRVAHPVYISIDKSRFGPAGADGLRAELGLAADTPLLGEVAQITPWKGQLEAIEALAHVRRVLPAAQLVLVGHVAFSGPGVRYDNEAYLARLRARVEELGLEQAVHFLGRRDDVPAILRSLDLMVLPSWDEPFGTAALEAMATGTPPIVSARGGAAEYVEDGVSGRVLAPHDPERWGAAAAELLADPARIRAMGARARAVAARFTDEAYAAGCLAVYDRALKARTH